MKQIIIVKVDAHIRFSSAEIIQMFEEHNANSTEVVLNEVVERK
jgi:hypothetical protein